MSVSGLSSPRLHASSFSACSAAGRRAAAGSPSPSTTSYNSILLSQCSTKPEPPRLLCQVKKRKDSSEVLQAKVKFTRNFRVLSAVVCSSASLIVLRLQRVPL